MQIEKPYFMENEEWYYYDDNDSERGYKLTDKAPEKAVRSYEEFYEELESSEIYPDFDEFINK